MVELNEDFIKFRDLVINNSEEIADEIYNSWYLMKECSDDIAYISDYLYNGQDPMDQINNEICKNLKTKEKIVLGSTLGQTLKDAAYGQVPNNRKKRTAALVGMLVIAINGEYLEDINDNDVISKLIVLLCLQNNWIIEMLPSITDMLQFNFEIFNLKFKF